MIERPGNLPAGRIAMGVEHAVSAVGGFPREGEPCSFPVEFRAPFNQLLNGRGAFGHQRPHRFRVAKTRAGDEGILLMEFHLVVVAENNGDTALRVLG